MLGCIPPKGSDVAVFCYGSMKCYFMVLLGMTLNVLLIYAVKPPETLNMYVCMFVLTTYISFCKSRYMILYRVVRKLKVFRIKRIITEAINALL